ncbi:PriCT-2 domain-containing protein, partial [Ligilactobacillus agilis]|uniref:PriCT-2 domain-containing protein n=1 Tax=Ligilactobacillus agilis TaxID=1601 RepID=UPI003F8C566E
MEKFNLLPLLDYIDPSSLDYTEWVQVGMALKEEGYTYNDWDSWSQRDSARYHEGECEKKWETFDSMGSVVTGATITQMAKENGWEPKMREENKAFGWDDSIEAVS